LFEDSGWQSAASRVPAGPSPAERGTTGGRAIALAGRLTARVAVSTPAGNGCGISSKPIGDKDDPPADPGG